jgi:hypothetical protein
MGLNEGNYFEVEAGQFGEKVEKSWQTETREFSSVTFTWATIRA